MRFPAFSGAIKSGLIALKSPPLLWMDFLNADNNRDG